MTTAAKISVLLLLFSCSHGSFGESEPNQPLTYSQLQRETRPLLLLQKLAGMHQRNKTSEKLKPLLGSYEESEKFEEREVFGDNMGKLLPEALWFALHDQVEDDGIALINARRDITQMLQSLGGLYLPNPDVIDNPQCQEDLDSIHSLSNIKNLTLMVDSWGKIPDGYLVGNSHVFGSFDECLKVKFQRGTKSDTDKYFRGQYCAVSYDKIEENRTEEIAVQMVPLLPDEMVASYYFMYGTCIPASCTPEDLQVSIDHHLQKMNRNLEVSGVNCQTEEYLPFEYTPGTIAMIIILAVEGTLIIGAGILDLWISHSGKEDLRKGPLKYLLAFSIVTNMGKMFHIDTSPSKGSITCFYGMRVLSMTWVIMGHQYMMTRSYSVNRNISPEIFNGSWLVQVILNAYPSVDTFFFMSGFLVAYIFFKEQQKGSRFNIVLYYFHRFIRLSPPIMLYSGFLATMQSQLVRGPMAYRITRSMESCSEFWYRDALFMSNFGGYDDDVYKGKCLGVSWYTSVDSQLYLASPLFILPFIFNGVLNRKFKGISAGVLWLGLLTLLSCIIPGAITAVNKLPPSSVQNAVNGHIHHTIIYYRPWCRASPYLVGMLLAYFIAKNKKEIKLQTWQVIAGWLTAVVFGLCVVFGMYNYNQLTDHPIEYHWAPSIFYGSLHGLLWGLALAWIVFACHYGYGGPINSFLSHPSFQPLNRLTYCIFLACLPLQSVVYNYNMVVSPYYSHLTKVIEVIGILFIGSIGGVLLSLYAEGPILGLEKLLLRKPSNNNKKQKEEIQKTHDETEMDITTITSETK